MIWYKVGKNESHIEEVEVLRETAQCLYIQRKNTGWYSGRTPKEERVLKQTEWSIYFRTVEEAAAAIQKRAVEKLERASVAHARAQAEWDAVKDAAAILVKRLQEERVTP